VPLDTRQAVVLCGRPWLGRCDLQGRGALLTGSIWHCRAIVWDVSLDLIQQQLHKGGVVLVRVLDLDMAGSACKP
jgi:hypothetical protein